MNRIAIVVVAAVLNLACLNGENRHAFYLEPDGVATWTVTQEDLRPEVDRPAGRGGAGAEYLARARRGELEVARALLGLGASWVEARVVRDRLPYTLVTEARFESSAQMIEEFLTRIGFEATAELRLEDGRGRLSFDFRELEAKLAGDDSEVVEMCLLEAAESYRFVLTEGEFLEATGFRLDETRTVATMIDPEEVAPGASQDGVSYSLSWAGTR